MARVLLTAAPWTYREIRHPDGMAPVKSIMGQLLPESTINGKMAFWSLLYLASWLRREGHDVDYLESYGCEESDWWARVERFKPDIIGFNAVTCTWPKTQQFIRELKRRYPDLVTVLGGSHANVSRAEPMEDCLDLDCVIFGEGELTLTELAQRVDRGERSAADLDGAVWRESDGTIRTGRARRNMPDVDVLPLPARDLIPQGQYNPRLNIYNKRQNTIIFTGRGCALTCASCHLPASGNRKFRIRSPKHIMAELTDCYDRYGITDFGFYDHYGIWSSWPDGAMELADRMARSPIDFSFTVTYWNFDFTRELLAKMKRAGCWRIDTVLISGVQKNLESATMGSPLKVEECEAGVHRIREAGIEVAARLSVGIKGESFDEAMVTADYACRLPLEWAFFTPVNPVFGSHLYKDYKKAGRFIKDERHHNIFNVFYDPETMTPSELKAAQRECYKRFYGRPGFMLKKLTRLNEPTYSHRNFTIASHLGRHLMGL